MKGSWLRKKKDMEKYNMSKDVVKLDKKINNKRFRLKTKINPRTIFEE